MRGSLYVTLAAMPLSLPLGPVCVTGRLGERKRKRGGHDVLLFLLGYPAGASAEEREALQCIDSIAIKFILTGSIPQCIC